MHCDVNGWTPARLAHVGDAATVLAGVWPLTLYVADMPLSSRRPNLAQALLERKFLL